MTISISLSVIQGLVLRYAVESIWFFCPIIDGIKSVVVSGLRFQSKAGAGGGNLFFNILSLVNQLQL